MTRIVALLHALLAATCAAIIAAIVAGGMCLLHLGLPAWEYRPVLVALTAPALLVVAAALAYRLLLVFDRREPGPVVPGTTRASTLNLLMLLDMFLLTPVTKSWILPIPLMTWLYRLQGLRIGAGSYIAGMVCEPGWVRLGSSTLIAHNATLVPHAIERGGYSMAPITIGSRCVVGVGAVVMGGVDMGDDATVAAGAVVLKGTRIGPGEVWAGVPARRIA